MKFHGCCNSAETQPLSLLPPGQPPQDGFTLKNTCEHALGVDFQDASDVLPDS